MNQLVKIFIDANVVIHSVADLDTLTDNDKWLRQEIPFIKEIISLKRQGKLQIEHDLNIMIEIQRKAKGRLKEINELWGSIILSPTFLEFQGMMGNPEEVKEGFTEPMRERKEYLKSIFNDDKLDFTHLVHAEFYGAEYFLTTDKRLINQVNNNKRNDALKVKVVSPSVLLKETASKHLRHISTTLL
jgi:hypothetical protein